MHQAQGMNRGQAPGHGNEKVVVGSHLASVAEKAKPRFDREAAIAKDQHARPFEKKLGDIDSLGLELRRRRASPRLAASPTSAGAGR